MTLRSPKGQEGYDDFCKGLPPGCPFCNIPKENKIIEVTTYWTIFWNKHKWDKVADEQIVVCLKRHLPQDEIRGLSDEENEDLLDIRERYSEYSYFHNGTKCKSQIHFHSQLIIFK